MPHLTEYGAAHKRLHKNTSQPERKNLMPSRGSPIVKSKPNVEGPDSKSKAPEGTAKDPENANLEGIKAKG